MKLLPPFSSLTLKALLAALVVPGVTLTFATNAQAQLIHFSSPVEIAGSSDISLAGDYVDAAGAFLFNAAVYPDPSSVQVTSTQSVDFNHLNFSTLSDGNNISFSNVSTGGGDLYYPPAGGPTIPGDYYNALLGVVYDGDATGTVSLSGLTPGDNYQVQVWKAVGALSIRATTFSGSDSENLLTSEFVIGTFTAPDAPIGETTSSETFTFGPDFADGGNTGEINAISLRNVTNVPEPTSSALMAGGLGILIFLLNRRQKSASPLI